MATIATATIMTKAFAAWRPAANALQSAHEKKSALTWNLIRSQAVVAIRDLRLPQM
jgi:hypothetical protein